MKQLGLALFSIGYGVLGIIGWFAEVDALNMVLGWPKFVSSIAALVTAGVPVLGSALAIWGAHAAWGWGWLPSIAWFAGGSVVCLTLALTGTMLEVSRPSMRRQRG